MQQQLQTQTSRIEELQQQCEELEASRAEEHARAKDRAAALDRAHAALADREREVGFMAVVGKLSCDEGSWKGWLESDMVSSQIGLEPASRSSKADSGKRSSSNSELCGGEPGQALGEALRSGWALPTPPVRSSSKRESWPPREVAALQLDSAKVGELKRRCDELEALRVEEQGRESEQTAALASAHAALEECERKVAALQLDTTRSTELQQRCNELEALRLEEQGRASDQAAALDRALAALEAREREVVALRLDSAEVEMLQRRCDELEALRIEEQGRANDALSSANADLDDRGREVAELQVDLDHALQELQEREAWAQESSKRLERMALYLEDERAKVEPEYLGPLCSAIFRTQYSLFDISHQVERGESPPLAQSKGGEGAALLLVVC